MEIDGLNKYVPRKVLFFSITSLTFFSPTSMTGYGDMAVSNSIGSNVFDILVCLGLPWLLNTAIVENGAPLKISSGGIAYSALILLSTVVFMLVAINLAKWKLNKPFGFLCMFAYVVVIALSCLFELNVFGEFVDPSCPRSSE